MKNGEINKYNLIKGNLVKQFINSYTVSSIDISSNSSMMVSGSLLGDIILYDFQTGYVLRKFK